MKAARIAHIAFLALIFPVAALVFTKDTWAASGNVQICNPNSSCTVGEFLYNDSYSPITTATCNITSRYPNGTLLLNNVGMPVSSQGDGWYAHTFTAPTTLGLYRTEVKCTTGSETLALDKSFEVQNPPTSAPSANDVASAVWGYSGRSLTTFGTLIADIWNNATRTLSDSTSSDISTIKSDLSSVKTSVGKIENVTSSTTSTTNITNISNTTNTTNNLLEQLINKPIIENGLEESSFTTTELQTKLEKSDKLANQLLTSGTYAKSKTNLMNKFLASPMKAGGGDITRTVNQLETVVNSMDERINWIADQWNLPISPKLKSQNQKIALSLKTMTAAPAAVKGLSTNIDAFLKLVGSTSDSSKSNTLFGQLKVQKELLSSLDKNYLEATTLAADIGKNSQPQADLVKHINTLSIQVAAINQLPKMNKTFFTKANIKMDQKQLKNKTLSLRGIVGANKQFLAQKPDQPLRSLWFEEGSIVFKTLISNPSKSISQKIPLKYYLPKEVTRENITKTDEELIVNYDTEKDQYFVSGNFTLEPLETKTLSVIVDDSAFYINDAQILTMRKQAEELSKPTLHTAYFAQGVTLKTDIDASLDKVDSLQKNNTTPEIRIRSYRESIIEFKAAKEKLEKLKELATTAGSVGTLFGFVGGAQALAVWGLIIIMVVGFVFLALYMRTLRNSEKYSAVSKPPIDDGFENYEEALSEERVQPSSPQKRFRIGKTVHLATILIAICIIGGGSAYTLFGLRQKQVISQNHSEVKPEPSIAPQSVLGVDSYEQSSSLNKEINVFVPADSEVSIFSEPSFQSTVLDTFSVSRKVKEVERKEAWVKILFEDINGKTTKGWVDEDFVDSDFKQKPQGEVGISSKMALINDTPTGFLRVRKTPGGVEITKVSPGEEYLSTGEETGWVQIVLEDGTSGWVSAKYISYDNSPQGGLR